MYLGLDLGTGLTKLASYPQAGPAGTGGGPPVTVVPTALIYRGLTSEIPADPARGRDGGDPAGQVRCDGFPAMLHAAWSADHVSAWQNRTPAEVAQDFLRCLLDDPDPQDGPGRAARRLVVAVPPAGHARTSAGRAGDRAIGTELYDILTALGRPPRRLVAAPVAAIMHLRHSRPGLAAASRVVVCDAGAGSIGLSLCTVGQRGIRVTDSLRLTGTSAFGDDTVAVADAGDRPPSLIECLVTMLARVNRAGAARNPDPVSARRWRALEHALADDGQRDRLDAVLQQAAAARQRHGGTVAVRFADLTVTAAQLLDACAPLAEQSATALTRLLRRQADPAWLRFGPGAGARIVLTGGLSLLHPLRNALLTSAGLDPGASGEAVIEPGNAERISAAAAGAAAIAAGQADPGDRYPHALRLPVHRTVRDRIVSGHLELAPVGSVDLELAETVFLTEDGEPVLVTVRPAVGPAGPVPLPVEIVPGGSGEPVPAVFRQEAQPRPGTYRIGVRGGLGGTAIVLQLTDGSEPLLYTLMDSADAAREQQDGRAPL